VHVSLFLTTIVSNSGKGVAIWSRIHSSNKPNQSRTCGRKTGCPDSYRDRFPVAFFRRSRSSGSYFFSI